MATTSGAAAPRAKVLMLTTDQAIDRRIRLQADSLTAAGFEVTILAVPGPPDDSPDVVRVDAESAPDQAGRRDFALLRAFRFAGRHLPLNAPWLAWIKGEIWRHVIAPDAFLERLMLPAALRYPADIVTAHDLPILRTAVAAARQHGAKLVYDSHELYCEQGFPSRTQRIWADVETRHIGACNAVMTVNPSIATELRQRYGLAHVHVVHNAEQVPDRSLENERLFHRAFALPADAFVVLFQGGLSAGRHLEALVDAMAEVATKSVHLVFLGDGPLARKLRQRARHASDRVHFHPPVPQRELLRYVASCDLGIIPYQANCLNNLYCTPNKLFEFIAAGLPMIATDLPELRRIIAGSGIGLVTDTGSPRSIAQAIDSLARDRAKLAALRADVIAAQKRWSWSEESKLLVEIYRCLIGRT